MFYFLNLKGSIQKYQNQFSDVFQGFVPRAPFPHIVQNASVSAVYLYALLMILGFGKLEFGNSLKSCST